MTRSRKGLLTFALALALALAVAACGGGEDSGSTAAEATDGGEATTASYEKRLQDLYVGTYHAPTGDAPKPEEGKNVWVVSAGQNIEAAEEATAVVEEAATKLGWDLTVFDGRFDPTRQLAGVEQALSDGADGIIALYLGCAPLRTGCPPREERTMEQVFIDGEYVDSSASAAIAVEDPAREETIAEVPDCGREDLERAIAAAQRAQREWSRQPSLSRSEVLYECAQRLEDNVEELAVVLTREGGKTLKENFDEIRFSATQFRYVAEVSRSERGTVVGNTRPDQLNLILREPIGVVAHILPYNYPVALLSWQVPAALAAGNACIVKPAEQTPLATLMLGRVLDCLPPGLFNVVTAGARGSAELVAHPGTGMIAFTGSVATGARIMEAAAPRIKKLLLELGGSDPFIVLGDANLEMAVEGGVFAAFLNAGQVCTSAERFFVQDSIYDEFVGGAVELAGSLRVGDPMTDVDVGSMVSAEARRQAADAVETLVGSGGRVLTGGGPPSGLDRGHFYAPTILELDSEASLPREELFGPVAAVTRVRDLDHAIQLANDHDLGLGASIYTSDLETAMRAATDLQAGTVWINDPLRDNDAAAFGGQKMSGVGRELGPDGLSAFTETKHVHIDFSASRGEDWWFPYERPELSGEASD